MNRSSRIVKLDSEHGQAAVEFALVVPLLMVLLLAIIQFGIVFNNYETLTDAARAGARRAIVTRIAGQDPTSVTETTVRSAAGSLDQSKLDVTVTAPSWTTPGSEVTVTATYPYAISLLGWVVTSGNLTSTMKEPLE